MLRGQRTFKSKGDTTRQDKLLTVYFSQNKHQSSTSSVHRQLPEMSPA